MRTFALLPALLAAGCGLSVVGLEALEINAPSEAGVDANVDVPDVGTEVRIDTGIDTGVDTGSPCIPSTQIQPDACGYYVDCASLHAAARDTPTGIYAFRRAEGVDPFEAYCDMTVADGGWTLVGQSVPNAPNQPFGWGSKTGNVRMTNQSYSLNALEQALPIHEVLVVRGSRTDLRTAYRITPPAGFPGDFANTSTLVAKMERIVNPDCMGADGERPDMLTHMGLTGRTDTFFFRDNDTPATYGLLPERWELNYGNHCGHAGDMHNEQGLLFVR